MLLSKEAFDLSKNFISNRMLLHPKQFPNALSVLDHLFFNSHNGYQLQCRKNGLLSIIDVRPLTEDDIKNEEASLSKRNLHYDIDKDFAEVTAISESKDRYLISYHSPHVDDTEFYILNEVDNINLQKNIDCQFSYIQASLAGVVESELEDNLHINVIKNSLPETCPAFSLYPFAYNDKRLLELLLFTAFYKKGVMYKLAECVDADISGYSHFSTMDKYINTFNQKILTLI
jgi:hypothetical protein